MYKTLREQFAALPDGVGAGYAAAPTRAPHVRIAKDAEGRPAIVSSFPDSGREALTRRLRNLIYIPRQAIEVQATNAPAREVAAAILLCSSSDPVLQEYFLRAVDAFLIDEHIETQRDFDRRIQGVVELFVAIEGQGRMSIQGVWGELFVIWQSADVGAAINAWHADRSGTFDFSNGRTKLEVKTSVTGRREHVFQLEQLRDSCENPCVVASILLQDDPEGESVADLVDAIATRWRHAESRSQIESKVVSLLGEAAPRAQDVRYGLTGGFRALKFVRAEHVPKVREPIPQGVSQVTFRSDLSYCDELSQMDLISLSEFHAGFRCGDHTTSSQWKRSK